MRIDRKTLYLVQEIDLGEGRSLFLHSQAITTATWELHYRHISAVYAAMMNEGLNVIAGPSVAMPMLKEIAIKRGVWEGDDGIQNSFLQELWRLTNVMVPTDQGWQMMPLATVMERDLIDPEALEEAKGAIVFFICVSAVLRGPKVKDQRDYLMGGMARLWGARIVSLPPTEFRNSLPMLTKPEATGTEVTVSSLPH